MTDSASPKSPTWHIIRLDLRDVIGVFGIALLLTGAAMIHWGVALAAAGIGLFALAFRLSRQD